MSLIQLIDLNKKCGKLCATLFILFVFFSIKVKANEFHQTHFPKDSLKNKYKLHDPQNSDCPCHTYQKKAEKEFKKQMRSKIKLQKTEQKQRLKEIKHLKCKLTIKRLLYYKVTALKNVSRTSTTRRHHTSKRGLFKKNIAACTHS